MWNSLKKDDFLLKMNKNQKADTILDQEVYLKPIEENDTE